MAVKQLKQHDARNDLRFLREIAILKECRSGHIVQFLVSLLLRSCASSLLQFLPQSLYCASNPAVP